MGNHISITQDWIKAFVIGYNLCPFAAKPFNENRIKYHLYDGTSIEKLAELLFLESNQLTVTDPAIIETTILIHPNVLTDFKDYFGLFSQVEEDLEQLSLDAEVQLASFHPDYQFAGTELDDPENFTNRSPFPMIHILRTASVEKAISNHPNTHQIPQDNIETMNRLGRMELIKKRNEIIGKN